MDRNMKRARARLAYDKLSRRWREDRRTQHQLIELGLAVPQPLLGKKPPFSVFMKCIPEGLDPLVVVKESAPVEFREYAHASQHRWNGDVYRGSPRLKLGEDPVTGAAIYSDGARDAAGLEDSNRGVQTMDMQTGDWNADEED